MKTLGQKIAEIRKNKGLTQEELAESAKVNLRTIQRLEAGNTTPRGNTMRAICEVLEVNLEDIFDYGKKEDINFLTYFHLSAASCIAIPLGNIILPMVLWLSKRDKISSLYEQGINLINFQVFMTIVTSIVFTTGILLKLEHSPYDNTFILGYFMINGLLVLYALVVALMVRKGKVRKYYPSLLRLIK